MSLTLFKGSSPTYFECTQDIPKEKQVYWLRIHGQSSERQCSKQAIDKKYPNFMHVSTERLRGVLYRVYTNNHGCYVVIEPYQQVCVAKADVEGDWLQHIEVSEDYRRLGIGTALLRGVLKDFPRLMVPAEMHGEHSLIATSAGLSLFAASVNRGILPYEQLIATTPRSPGRLY